MLQQGVTAGIHYVDDFFFASPTQAACQHQLHLAIATCDQLGVPIARHKLEGPATVLYFLGISIDTVRGELSLPQEKLLRTRASLDHWVHRKACSKRDLLSLLGELYHFSFIIRPGHSFLRQLIELSKLPKHLHHRVRLSRSARSDIM